MSLPGTRYVHHRPIIMEASPTTTVEPPTRQPLDPLFTIWTQPRATIRRVVDRPALQVMVLAVAGGLYTGLSWCIDWNVGDRYPLDPFLAVLLVVVVSALLSIPLLYLFAWVLRQTGRLLGGQADLWEIRAAIAWSVVPLLVGLALLALQLPIFGEKLFLSSYTLAGLGSQLVLFVFEALGFVLEVWVLVVFVVALAEVQRFAIWQALVNLVLMAVAVSAPLLAIVYVAAPLFS